MELFLPSLLALVVSAFFIFLILPRMGSLILTIVCIVALILAGIHHYSMFQSEYRLSTWQYGIAAYTPYIILGLALLFVLSTIYSFLTLGSLGPLNSVTNTVANAISTPMEAIQEGVQNSVNAMTSTNAPPTNPLTSAINTGLNSLNSGANTNANKARNANKRSPAIPGYGFPASQI